MKRTIILMLCVVVFMACGKEQSQETTTTTTSSYADVKIPEFSADSAYNYIKMQCDFGPRTPNSKAHKLCGDYMYDVLNSFADTVVNQYFTSRLYDGTKVEGRNIIASFNPESQTRLMFAAHWDSRLWADCDPDPKNHKTPILGANDGASGVGVLLEIARLLSLNKQDVGIDLIMFDMEDQGCPEWDQNTVQDQSDWCLGSQYWSTHTHLPFYQANFAILLDMVGANNAIFPKEEISMHYGSTIMNKVWNIARDRGYGSMFVEDRTGGVMDDHYWVNRNLNLPMINIVHYNNSSFFPYWHTLKDDMSNINKNTLKAVGDVCLTVIYGM